ncbi:hypothetical protein Lalb_Chr11g0067901 [Lupinus albus]|uniref:Transmembrane protein n=1 Tax=Lupinus albus TaxID=3870 RepID=A0A6A4PR21_LUPAL|nr:hypothetical protein Lalb_Chr11g0067901 [Lupinus albus]
MVYYPYFSNIYWCTLFINNKINRKIIIRILRVKIFKCINLVTKKLNNPKSSQQNIKLHFKLLISNLRIFSLISLLTPYLISNISLSSFYHSFLFLFFS